MFKKGRGSLKMQRVKKYENYKLPDGKLFVIDLNCALTCRCVQPELPPGSGVSLYLPHCVEGLTLNYCQAVCQGKQVSQSHSQKYFINW